MSDFLVNHAIKNVWCTPNQDNQLIVKPARLTPNNGVWNTYTFLWTTVEMPELNERFHLYQIGQLPASFFNLFGDEAFTNPIGSPAAISQSESFSKNNGWVSFAEASRVGSTVIDIYVTSGVQLPRTQTYYYITKQKALLIAVKKNTKINFDFDADSIYLRVYDNAYFKSLRSDPLLDIIDVQGGIMTSVADITSLQTKYLAKRSMPGGVYAFINGYKQSEINLVNTKVGDVAEYVYDSSIIRTIDFQISALDTFDSTLDSKGKYLFHYAGVGDPTIDYFDDIDLFMIDISTQKGVYVHKNAADTIRMLTHRDYSIPVSYLSAYYPHFHDAQGGLTESNIYLRMHVRKSGYLRGLVFEHHHIYDLYRLPSVSVPRAMLGVDATVAVWRADSLESSAYTELMGADYCNITKDLVTRAYGYHAVTKLIADTPVKVNRLDPLRIVPVPFLLQFDATMFEYDQNGLLIDYYRHISGIIYACHSQDAYYVEMISGEGTLVIEDHYGTSPVTLNIFTSYKYYTCPKVNGIATNVWTDVTNTSAYVVTDGVATWTTTTGIEGLARSDKKFLLDTKYVSMNEGVLGFSLAHTQTRNGTTSVANMQIPMGELDVFLNGHSLIEGLDFVVDFPNVVICTKEYFVNPLSQAQKIVYRYTGFCNSELKPTPKNEFGFIQHGKVSVNNRYDIHMGKVLRLVAGGRLHTTDELIFSEDTSSLDFDSLDNGTPYLIRDLVVPMKDVVSVETYTYRSESLIVDKAVSDYMSLKRPEADPPVVNPILNRYKLYSPFICKVMQSLIDGIITDPTLTGQYNDTKVRELCAPYEYLLDSDPIYPANQLSPDYVTIHPHFVNTVIGLNLTMYKFMNKVVRIYANGKIDLSAFVQIV